MGAVGITVDKDGVGALGEAEILGQQGRYGAKGATAGGAAARTVAIEGVEKTVARLVAHGAAATAAVQKPCLGMWIRLRHRCPFPQSGR